MALASLSRALAQGSPLFDRQSDVPGPGFARSIQVAAVDAVARLAFARSVAYHGHIVKSPNAPRNIDRFGSPWPHRLAWLLALAVFPLIWMGGTVTTYEAGMAVPDWPTTYDYWFYPIEPWLGVWDVFLEHSHRLLGELAGLLAIALALSLWRCDDRKWMRWVGVALVVGVIAQGTLGGIRVLANDRVLARIHGCTAPLFFALCAASVTWTSRAWRRATSACRSAFAAVDARCEGRSRLLRLAWLVTAAIYVEIVLGAELRRPSASAGFGADELFQWCVWLKVVNAFLIALGVASLLVGIVRQQNLRRLFARAWWFAAIVAVQIVLAVVTWVANYGWPAWFTGWIWPLQSSIVAQGRLLVLVTTAHAAVGSLTFVASIALTLWLSIEPQSNTVGPERRRWLYWRLIRPRIVLLVLVAMAASAWITSPSPPSGLSLFHALLGSALVIAGALAMNQRLESQSDGRMPRTADRPIPAGQLTKRQATWFGAITTIAGLVYLLVAANVSLAVLAAVGWMVYVVVYTPLKTRSPWQTPIGAVAGAIPVLLGSAAVGQLSNPWTFVVFAVVYCWQFPHSMAIAWRYRREFAAADVKLAAVTDSTGRRAGVWAVLGANFLLIVSVAPVWCGLAGPIYGATALVLGGFFLAASARFARRLDDASARQLLLASLIYLPAILAAILTVERV